MVEKNGTMKLKYLGNFGSGQYEMKFPVNITPMTNKKFTLFSEYSQRFASLYFWYRLPEILYDIYDSIESYDIFDSIESWEKNQNLSRSSIKLQLNLTTDERLWIFQL